MRILKSYTWLFDFSPVKDIERLSIFRPHFPQIKYDVCFFDQQFSICLLCDGDTFFIFFI